MSSNVFVGRTLARSQALQLLFQAESTDQTVSDVLDGAYALSQWPLDEYGERLALGADQHRDQIDAVISRSSTNWPIDRMPSVDRNLLRLAIYEMTMEEDVAIAVSIDESVELAKAYGTDESSRFVNGLLGRVASDIEAGEDVLALAAEAAEAADDTVVEEEAAEPEGDEVAEVQAVESDAEDGQDDDAYDVDEEQ